MDDSKQKLQRMDPIDNVMNKVFIFINFFAIAATGVILLVTVANVLMRALFAQPIKGALELSTDMMVMVSYCSLPIVTMLSRHISVDLLAGRFSANAQAVLKIFNLIVYSVLCVFAGYATFVKGAYEFNLGTCGSSLRIPYWIFYYIIGVMLFISVVCALYNIIHVIVTGEEVNEIRLDEYVRSLRKGEKNP